MSRACFFFSPCWILITDSFCNATDKKKKKKWYRLNDCVQIDKYKHIQINRYVYKHIHTNKTRHTNIYTNTYGWTDTHTETRTHTETHTQRHSHVHTKVTIHEHRNMVTCTHRCLDMNTFPRTLIRAHDLRTHWY